MFLTRGRSAVAVLVLVTFVGCSNATITRNYGPRYEAQIVGSDVRSLRVRDGGYEFVIPREDVRKIDHPGSGLLGAGAIVAGVFAPYTIDAIDHGKPTAMIGVSAVLTGFVLALSGLIPYRRSKNAAAAFENAVPVVPAAQPPLPFAPPPPSGIPTP
jgi:hypothetical protein